MMDELERALGPGAALIFATHDVDLALRHATRWILLEGGRLLADGPPWALIQQLPAELPLPPLQRWLLERELPPAGLDEVLSWA
jgi:energy-coupling factor transporter ATP-binding protein EcfA2